MLQTKNIMVIIDVVKKNVQDLEAFRSDEELSLVSDEVKEFKRQSTNEYDDFKPLSKNPVRRVPRMAGEMKLLKIRCRT